MTNELLNSGLVAQKAAESFGVYLCNQDEEDLFAPCYTIEINDDHGVRFLRRLLTIDVRNVRRGQVRQSFVLNALGFVTDFVTVVHLPDADEHFRVIFQSIDTLAWMHQVAKAFDVELHDPEVSTALVYGKTLPTIGGLNHEHCCEVEAGLWVFKTSYGLVVQGKDDQLSNFVSQLGGEQLDWVGAYTLSILAKEPHAMDWMASDVTVDALNGADFVDFSDPSRVFIGRALTEARIRAMQSKKTVVLKSHMDNAADWFEEPDTVVIGNSEGEMFAKSVRFGLLGESLITSVTLPTTADVNSLLWIVGLEGEPLAYTVEEIK